MVLRLPNLPQEIIDEILTRLPVKSLLRFRCVSKSWLSLIDTPHFIKSHLNNCNSHRLGFISPYDLPVAIYSCLVDSATRELSPVKVTLLDSPCNETRVLVGFVGSCNGLICISILGDYCLFLWNPSIKKSRKLPLPDEPPYDDDAVVHGFGYDELNDDYKVIQFFSSTCSENAFNVYSLRTNSWKRIKGSPTFPPACKFANGALHWLVKHFDGLNLTLSISSFDLANETFQNIDVPNSTDAFSFWDLEVLGGRLYLCCDYYQDCLDLWILKNGVKGYWTKLVSIPYSIDSKGSIFPLSVLDTGEILLMCESKFMLYNKKDETFYYLDIHMNHTGCTSFSFDDIEACVYVESLVSPVTGGEGWN